MSKSPVAILACIVVCGCATQIGERQKPWARPAAVLVLDVYE